MMKAKILGLMVVTALVVAQSGVALAQGGNWSAVQGVAADERLVVKTKDGHSMEAKMIEATDTNLTVSRDKKVVSIPRDNVKQVEHVVGKANKAKWAGIGAAAGLGTGAAIGGYKASNTGDDGRTYTFMGVLIGTGIGAATGVAFGATKRKRELIYSVP